MDDAGIARWLEQAVVARFPHATPVAVTALKGDASTRRFWRVTLASTTTAASTMPISAIAIDLGPDDLPLYARALKLIPEPLAEPPWLNLHRFLTAIGAPVPQLYLADPQSRMLLVEDVGTRSLFEAAQQGDAADLYRLAVDALVQLHRETPSPDCLGGRIAYDERLFRWELEQFLEVAGELAPSIERAVLIPECDALAAQLGRLSRVFSHRDYHGNNLFVQMDSQGPPRIRMIDFQDALMAPAAQDLAVLLTTRDTSRIISERVEQRLLDYYFARGIRDGARGVAFPEFIESYRLCVLQHALKVIGRFIYLERSGKHGYSVYIPFALAQARRMLANQSAFPALRSAIGA